MRFVGIFLMTAGLMLGSTACSEEGPAEKAGRHFEEAVDDLRDAGDGPLERLGEDIDEAIDEAGEALDDAVDKARKAVKNADR